MRDPRLPELATVSEVARMLHCHRQTVLDRMRRGELRGYRVSSRRYMIAVEDVYAYLDRALVRPSATDVPG